MLQKTKSKTEQGNQQQGAGGQCVPSEVEALVDDEENLRPILIDVAGQFSASLLSFVLCQITRYKPISIHISETTADQEKYPKLHTTVYMRFLVLSNVQLSNLAPGYLNHP